MIPKVSIIIPFNNVESYIEQCLDSVLSQTLKDIEIILIDDASTDKSRNIVQKYADNDKRIKIIDISEQKGQGFARNRAIEVATGEYIGFVDSDDFVEPNMFEELYNAASINDTDITMCQVKEYDDLNECFITSDYYSLEPLISFEEKIFSPKETKEQILDINVALWNKVYKREYLEKIGEKFPEGYIYEDLPFFFGTYLPAERINIVWKNLYNYRINRKNSTMQQVNNKVLDRLSMVSLTYEKLKPIEYLADFKKRIQGWIIDDLFHRYTLLKENYHKEYFFLMKKVFENLEIENIEDEYWKRVYHFEGYLLVINNTFEDFNQKVFCDYLDIHEVEKRILSRVLERDEADKRFSLLYDDLGKVYKYSEHIVNNAENRVREDLKVDEKITRVYEEITRNYEYTNKLTSELKESFQSELPLESERIKVCTDEKISKVYEEITNNYEFTKDLCSSLKMELSQNEERVNELSIDLKSEIEEKTNDLSIGFKKEIEEKTSDLSIDLKKEIEAKINDLSIDLKKEIKQKTIDLYSDIKDLSFVINDNFIELSKEQEKIREEYQTVIDDVAKLHKERTDEKISSINDRLDQLSSCIEEQKRQNDIVLSEFVKKIEQDRQQTYEFISNMKSEFINILREEQIKHKEEILEFKHQIKELEYDLRLELKSPLKKIVEKYKNKQEK